MRVLLRRSNLSRRIPRLAEVREVAGVVVVGGVVVVVVAAVVVVIEVVVSAMTVVVASTIYPCGTDTIRFVGMVSCVDSSAHRSHSLDCCSTLRSSERSLLE